MSRVLIAIDGSEHSTRALKWYAANLINPHDEIVFLMVVEPRAARSASLSAVEAPKYVYFSERNCDAPVRRDAISSAKKTCASLKIANPLRFVEKVSSSPGSAIVEAANEENADMIVLGNRGSMGVLRRTFLGSVSDYVLHHAHRPVAVVPPKKS